MTRSRKFLPLLVALSGIALIVCGSLLPWTCYTPALAFFCIPGIEFNFDIAHDLSIVQVVFIFWTVVVISYLLNANRIFKRRWQTIAIACVTSIPLFLVIAAGFIMTGRGLIFVIGAIVAAGAIFHSNRQANKIAMSVILLLVLFALYNLLMAPPPAVGFEAYGSADWKGRLLVLLGSILLLGASFLEKRLAIHSLAVDSFPPQD